MRVLTLILAGGVGSRLSVLGAQRTKAAVPFGGTYRIIDFALSNAVHSGLDRVAVLTQYLPHSLNAHLRNGRPWGLDRTASGIEVWQPYQGRGDQGWHRGTADAVYQNRDMITNTGCDTLLVLAGDHIYTQDYRDLLRYHQEQSADLTVAVRPVRPDETPRFGMVSVDASNRITTFEEKPAQSQSTLGSMGIYVFSTAVLLRRLAEDTRDPASVHDFGTNLIPRMLQHDTVVAYPFAGYWVDVGTVQSYWEANLDLVAEHPRLDLYDPAWVIATHREERPPVKLGSHAVAQSSLLSHGCVIEGRVINSVLSPGVRVERGAVIRDSVILHDTTIRTGAVIDRCVLDKQVDVGADAQVGTGDASTPNQCEPGNLNTGVTIVGKGAALPPGVIIGRNCRIDAQVTWAAFTQAVIPSGTTVSV